MAALASLAISVVVIVVDASSADHSVLPLLIAPAVAIGAVALARALKTTPSLRLVEMVLLATMIWFVTARGYMTISGADSPADARGAWTTAVLTSILLLGGYAMLIPTMMRRAAISLLAVAFATTGMVLLVRMNHARLSAAIDGSALATGLALLGLATLLALAGVGFITKFRDLFIGEKDIGMYDLKHQIAQGGMGEVWLAEHQRLARPAAIKIIREDKLGTKNPASTERLIRRFEREAKATAGLRSPHTVEIYDFGLSASGVFYYVMEYLDGIDLQVLVNEYGPQSAARTSYLLAQVCDALAEAHEHGLIHRDIKPANIHCTRMGLQYDFVKVLDYGLVKPVDKPIGQSEISMEGVAHGTPAYMPPEMATGSTDVDGRTDIYAIGCVGYWLLTGTVVFDAKTAMQMAIQHVTESPQAASTRLGSQLPADIEAVIMKCLEKNPDDRYQTAGELAEALAACGCAAAWSNEHARAWWQDNTPETNRARS